MGDNLLKELIGTTSASSWWIGGYLSHSTTASPAHIYPAQIFKLPNLRQCRGQDNQYGGNHFPKSRHFSIAPPKNQCHNN